MEIGPGRVSERILDRAQRVREIARSAGWDIYGSTQPEDHSGIVAIENHDIDPNAFVHSLRSQGIAVASRRGKVRVSPHLYNNEEDLERLFEALWIG